MTQPQHVELIMSAITDLKLEVRADLDEVKSHLARLNGRTAKVESGIRVHWVLWTILGVAVAATIPFVLERVWPIL